MEWTINIGYLIRVAVGVIAGLIMGFMITRSALRKRYIHELQGTLRLVYDPDDPSHPVMGLAIETMDYILHNDYILLEIERKNFPNSNGVELTAKKPDA